MAIDGLLSPLRDQRPIQERSETRELLSRIRHLAQNGYRFLFVAEGGDGVEIGGAYGGIEAEYDADGHGNADGKAEGHAGDDGGHSGEEGHGPGDGDADEAAGGGKDDGFD